MFRKLMRYVFAVVFSVNLVTEAAVHSVLAAETSLQSAVTNVSADHSTSATHRGCADEQKTAPGDTCNLLCASAVALPAMMIRVDAVPLGRVDAAAASVVIDHITPPDTHPPKSA